MPRGVQPGPFSRVSIVGDSMWRRFLNVWPWLRKGIVSPAVASLNDVLACRDPIRRDFARSINRRDTMTFQKLASGLLLVALAMPATTVCAAGDETITNTPTRESGLVASIERAAATVAVQGSAPIAATRVAASATSNATIPLVLPRRVRVNKGMAAGMMVMSLVGTAAGIAGTYYMVKTLKDQ